MYVCLSEHAILAVRAIRSITKDAIVLSVRFAAIESFRLTLTLNVEWSCDHETRGRRDWQ